MQTKDGCQGWQRQKCMRWKIKSLFLAEVTLLWAPRQQPGQESESHFMVCAPRVAVPVLELGYPSELGADVPAKVSSAVVRCQPQPPASRRKPRATRSLEANNNNIAYGPAPLFPYYPTVSPLYLYTRKLTMTFTLQLLLCLKIHVDDEWTQR